MPKVEVSTRIEAGRRDAIEKEAKRRGSSVAEILRERIEAGEPIERMERIVEVLARTVAELKVELSAGINRLDLRQEQAARQLAQLDDTHAKHTRAVALAIRDLAVATRESTAAMKTISDAIKE